MSVNMSLVEVTLRPSKSETVTKQIKRTYDALATESYAKIHYAFRVSGENKIIIVTEDEESDIADVIYRHHGDGAQVTCIPIYPYETFAKNICGVDKPSGKLTPGGSILFFRGKVTFTGQESSELIDTWRDEAEQFFSMRDNGVEIVGYKAVGTKTIFGFLKLSDEDFDKACLMVLPMTTRSPNIIHVHIETHRVQLL